MDQWEFEVWREEFRRLNWISHREQEKAGLNRLMAKAKRGK